MERAPGERVRERDLWLRVDCVLRRLCEDEWRRLLEWECVDLRLMTEAASSSRPILNDKRGGKSNKKKVVGSPERDGYSSDRDM